MRRRGRRGANARAVGRGREARAQEDAVGIRVRVDDVALVEMGVDVDERRPDVPAREIDAGEGIGGIGGCDARNPPVLDFDIDQQAAVAVSRGCGRWVRQQAGGHTRAPQGIALPFRNFDRFECCHRGPKSTEL